MSITFPSPRARGEGRVRGASENLVSQGCNCCATLAMTSAKKSAPHPPHLHELQALAQLLQLSRLV